MGESLFTDAQRHSIGVCVAQLEELARALRDYGVVSPFLDELERAIGELETTTDALRPRPPGNRVPAALAQMRVLAEELRPRRMAGYGEVSPAAAATLDTQVGRLIELLDRVGADALG